MQQSFLIGLTILVTVAFGALLLDFFQPILWAAVFGIIFLPVQHYLERALKGRASLAALLTVMLIFVTVIVPALLIASAVVREAAELYAKINSGAIDPAAPLRWLESMLPQATRFAESIGIDINETKDNLSLVAVKGSQFVGSLALSAGQNAVRFSVMFFIMLYLLFFVLRDGDDMLDKITKAIPLGEARERALLAKFATVSRATIKGTLIVGVVQGTLGGFIFWALGIQAAVFWGVVMVAMSMLPAIGAALIWVPAAIVLMAGGAYIKAMILVVFGVLVIGLADNLLRPMLIGRDTRMPDYLILLSTIGGITLFGISGFVIGPLIAALFLTVWEMFALEYSDDHSG